MQEEDIRKLVRKTVLKALDGASAEPDAARKRRTLSGRKLVTEEDLQGAAVGSEVAIPTHALVTPLARDLARERQLTLIEERQGASISASLLQPAAQSRAVQPSASPEKTVAVGADHGGFPLKEDLKKYLAELGYVVLDCGTTSTQSVDYPDFAYAVARLVRGGQRAGS